MKTPPNILIADDEPDTVMFLEQICKREGYDVSVAENGVQALEYIKTQIPDLILLDIQMPLLNGFEVVEALQENENTASIPIIVLTANATKPEQAIKGLDIGADDYIIKPFNFRELLARIRAKLRTRELEENLKKKRNELDMLVRLGMALNNAKEPEHLIHEILNFLLNELPFDASTLELLPATGVHNGFSKTIYTDGKIHTTQSFGNIIENSDTPHLEYIYSLSDAKNILIAPLEEEDTNLGNLYICSNSFVQNPDNRRVIQAASRQITLAIRNSYLYSSLQVYATNLEDLVDERTKELELAQKQLIRSEKLASIGRLAGEIAHEINNPLQPIIINLQSVLEDIQDDIPVDTQAIDIMLEEAERLKRTVKRLLNFARPDTKGIREVSLYEIIQDVLALTQKKIEHTNVKLVTSLNADITNVSVAPDQIKQVLLNLAINAIEAMSNVDQATLTIELASDNKNAQIVIIDNGHGMTKEQINQIFEPFFSTKEHGSGLGLAITHSIIEAHGGKIQVESELHQGTKFTILLPFTT